VKRLVDRVIQSLVASDAQPTTSNARPTTPAAASPVRQQTPPAPPSPPSPSLRTLSLLERLPELTSHELAELVDCTTVAAVLEASTGGRAPAARLLAADLLARSFKSVVRATQGGIGRLRAALNDDKVWATLTVEADLHERLRTVAHTSGLVLEKSQVITPPRQNADGPATYPLECLLSSVAWPSDVDPARRERSLHEDEFVALFQMGKPEFEKLPGWKQRELRKKHDLF